MFDNEYKGVCFSRCQNYNKKTSSEGTVNMNYKDDCPCMKA